MLEIYFWPHRTNNSQIMVKSNIDEGKVKWNSHFTELKNKIFMKLFPFVVIIHFISGKLFFIEQQIANWFNHFINLTQFFFSPIKSYKNVQKINQIV